MKTLNVHSIFTSIDGEVSYFGQGKISTFIRLAQCNLQCQWCDTEYARHKNSGIEMTIEDIMKEIELRKVNKVTITGGEPLLQDGIMELTKELWINKIYCSIETNGTIEPFGYSVDSFVVDYKLPSSGMEHMMLPEAFLFLRKCDFIKFVVADEIDFETAVMKAKIIRHTNKNVQFAFSPMINQTGDFMPPQELLQKLLNAGLGDSYINVQLHKLIGLK